MKYCFFSSSWNYIKLCLTCMFEISWSLDTLSLKILATCQCEWGKSVLHKIFSHRLLFWSQVIYLNFLCSTCFSSRLGQTVYCVFWRGLCSSAHAVPSRYIEVRILRLTGKMTLISTDWEFVASTQLLSQGLEIAGLWCEQYFAKFRISANCFFFPASVITVFLGLVCI